MTTAFAHDWAQVQRMVGWQRTLFSVMNATRIKHAPTSTAISSPIAAQPAVVPASLQACARDGFRHGSWQCRRVWAW